MLKIYKKKNNKIKIVEKIIIIHAFISLNNFILTLTDIKGNTLNWFSSGTLGFKGFRKHTPLAVEELIKKLKEELIKFNIKNVILKIKGIGSSKLGFLKYLVESDINFLKIEDVSTFAFNGCRPQKRRKL